MGNAADETTLQSKIKKFSYCLVLRVNTAAVSHKRY